MESSGLNEDILTKHLLKLNEIEDQFRELTNKFEEVNFKLDKLSSRVTRVLAIANSRSNSIAMAQNDGDAQIVRVSRNYQSFTQPLGFHPTTRFSPDYLGFTQLLGFHPTTRDSPNYQGFTRLLGFHPNPIVPPNSQSSIQLLELHLIPKRSYLYASIYLFDMTSIRECFTFQ